jgi:hypothetical protein
MPDVGPSTSPPPCPRHARFEPSASHTPVRFGCTRLAVAVEDRRACLPRKRNLEEAIRRRKDPRERPMQVTSAHRLQHEDGGIPSTGSDLYAPALLAIQRITQQVDHARRER